MCSLSCRGARPESHIVDKPYAPIAPKSPLGPARNSRTGRDEPPCRNGCHTMGRGLARVILGFSDPAQIRKAAIAHDDDVVPAFLFERHKGQELAARMNQLIFDPKPRRDLAECAGV